MVSQKNQNLCCAADFNFLSNHRESPMQYNPFSDRENLSLVLSATAVACGVDEHTVFYASKLSG